jgi:hypothetical protein
VRRHSQSATLMNRERSEALLKGRAALARVLERQRNDGRRRAQEDSVRKEGLPKRTPRSALTREELNHIRRERYRTHAAEINRRRREQRRAHVAEINLKRQEWRQRHATEVNRQQREAYRRRRGALETVQAGRLIGQGPSAQGRGGGTECGAARTVRREPAGKQRAGSSRDSIVENCEILPATTLSEHISIEPAVMASEIERLPDLAGFLKFSSIPDWRYVRLRPVDYPHRIQGRPGGTADPSARENGGDGARRE